MKNETYRIALISFILIALAFLFAGAAFADDEKDNDDPQEAVTEEQMTDMEDSDEEMTVEEDEDIEVIEVTYLDDADSSDGSIELVFQLDESDENSFFHRRYQDLWSGDDFYLGQVWYRGWEEDNSIIRINLRNFVDPSWHGRIDWLMPGELWAWINLSRNRQYEIPSEFTETWRHTSLGFEIYSECSQTWHIEYNRVEDVIRESIGEPGATDWLTDNAALRYSFDWSGWDGSVEFSQRSYDDRTGNINDVEHTTGIIRAGRNFDDANYVEGNVLYNVADVNDGDDLKTLHLGGYGRFVNALGIDRFNVTSHIGWDNRTDGPSRLHPAGDEFTFDIGARWRPAPEISLYGSWDYQKEDVTHGDQYTVYHYRFNPQGSEPELGRLMSTEVEASKWNVGGRWDVAEGFDFNVDLTWLDRDGLPLTDLVYAESPSLFWESETNFKYSLRYHHGTAADTTSGDWLLMYETCNRDNSARESETSSKHLSINWTGNLHPDVWIYAGGGYLRADNNYLGTQMLDEDGTEYGGGWNWTMAEDWNLYGDYWRYEVDGQWGYDQTSFMAGLEHSFDENWELAVEYDTVSGDFDDLAYLDYDFDEFLVRFSYNW